MTRVSHCARNVRGDLSLPKELVWKDKRQAVAAQPTKQLCSKSLDTGSSGNLMSKLLMTESALLAITFNVGVDIDNVTFSPQYIGF